MNVARKKQDRSGTAAVEFALIAPVFLVLVFGLFELSRMIMLQQALTNAAREGCRTAKLATTLSSSRVETAVRQYLRATTSHANDAAMVRVGVPTALDMVTTGTDLAVSVEVNYGDMSWMPFAYVGLMPTIRAEEVVKRE